MRVLCVQATSCLVLGWNLAYVQDKTEDDKTTNGACLGDTSA
jgi:hypothetical protein